MKSKINKLFGKIQWWIGLCLCFCFLAGCEDAGMTADPPVPGVNGMLPFDLGSAVSSGSKVRVLLFSAPTESGNRSFRYNKLFTGLSGFNVPLYPGEYNDVYTVIDEETDLSSVADWASFAAVKISRSLPSDVNAVKQRYYEYKNIHALNDGSGRILYNGEDISKTGLRSSVYTMARVFLSFDVIPGSPEVSLHFREAELSNVPGFGYLYPKAYDGTGYVKKTVSLEAPNAADGRYKFETQLLVPEYLLASGSTPRMTLTIRADRYRGDVKEGSSEYALNVGNDIAVGGMNGNVDRNKVYMFNFTGVTGWGQEVDDWRVMTAVENWDERVVDSEIGDANSFFLQTEQIDSFRAFRMPRYVSFKTTGPGTVWVDKPRELNREDTVALNDFMCNVLWDDDTHRSGQLALSLGNWRTGGNFSVRIKLRANNIEKTLVVNCSGARYAVQFLPTMDWAQAMGYEDGANYNYASISIEEMMRLYSIERARYRGCADYFEGDPDNSLTGRGCWRVSTIREGLYYLKKNKLAKELWAYEIGGSSKSYYVGTLWGYPSDLYHPDNYYWVLLRKDGVRHPEVLCVQDDRLEKYYFLEVNRADYSGNVAFMDASNFCLKLTEGGKEGWRLPTAEEAKYAIVNAGRQGIPNNFNAEWYWMADGKAVGLANPDGTAPPEMVANVRCVRVRF